MLKEVFNIMENIVIFENDSWLIELRPRNNAHEGEPGMKVWVSREGQEVAQFSNKYRGYGRYKDNEDLLPPKIVEVAKKAWDKLKEAPLNEETIEEMKKLMD
jgi:hypothetical protein